jgi:hypothetical protein
MMISFNEIRDDPFYLKKRRNGHSENIIEDIGNHNKREKKTINREIAMIQAR